MIQNHPLLPSREFNSILQLLRLKKEQSPKLLTSRYAVGSKSHHLVDRIWIVCLKDPTEYLKTYFQRNLSEVAFSADKKRFGWVIRQKREDRQEMAYSPFFCTIFSVRIVPE